MKYLCFTFYVILVACGGLDKYEKHDSYHELDNIPFYFSTEFEGGELVLSITPKNKGEAYFPVLVKFSDSDSDSDSDDDFLGDLILSKSKVKSDINYTQKKIKSGIVSVVRIPADGRGLYNKQGSIEMAIYIYENGFTEEEKNGFKIHRAGHMWGEHFHIGVTAEAD